MLDSKDTKQSEWLKIYKKECVQLNNSLYDLTEKQLKKLSRLMQNRCRKLISTYGFKNERSKSGAEIIYLSENIKDEYKDEFWENVYLSLFLDKNRKSDLVDKETWQSWFKFGKDVVRYKSFENFIKNVHEIKVPKPSVSSSFFYDLDKLLYTCEKFLKQIRIFFDLKENSFVVDCKLSSAETNQHLVALFEKNNFRSQDRILIPKSPIDLNVIIFKATIYEFVFPEQAGKVWDELVVSEKFLSYLKTFSQNNINNNLTTTEGFEFLEQIEDGYLPMMKELPVSELMEKLNH